MDEPQWPCVHNADPMNEPLNIKDMKDKSYYIKKIQQLLRQEVKADLKYGLSRTEIDYLDSCMNHFSILQSGLPSTFGRFFGKSKKEILQAQEMWTEIKQEMTGLIPDIIKGAKADLMKGEIMAITAKSLVECAMAEAGLQFRFIEQRYRARIEVKVTDASKLTFYLNYKKTPELLPSVIEAVKTIKENISLLGKTATVGKINSWEKWE